MHRLLTPAAPLILILHLGACSTTDTAAIPKSKKPDTAVMTQIEASQALIVRDGDGIGASWGSFDAAQDDSDSRFLGPTKTPVRIGLAIFDPIGTLGGLVLNQAADAAPAARARRSTRWINAGLDADALDARLVSKVEAARQNGRLAVSDVGGVSPQGVTPEALAATTENRLLIAADYTLSEDASALRVGATVSYAPGAVAGQTPEGPIYRNRIVYHAAPLDLPELTVERRAALRAQVQADFDEDAAALDALAPEARDEGRAELEAARDDILRVLDATASETDLGKTERAALLTLAWRDGPLAAELDQGQDFIVSGLAADLQDPTPITKRKRSDTARAREDETLGVLEHVDFDVIETGPDGRRTLRVTSGRRTGQLFSIPAAGIRDYGNTAAIVGEARGLPRSITP